ncbi:acyl-CoA dehydrogenase family protein [Musicola paradisiaca]|uniref:Acyl-CoA dehydrogenase domain protein n=1 Tax=Musicola paradisiaca (strain Ech703) TaxID=579405 RepID=C6C6K3_MUSP7|nr:acyl-CoA dehydrogenase family protein [Musicola paradisiaca]ACS83922.1 acyl-CoA dehydrogenase domain protein [Musicola paradisiaca Ech703]
MKALTFSNLKKDLDALGEKLRLAAGQMETDRALALSSLEDELLYVISYIGIPPQFIPFRGWDYEACSYQDNIDMLEYLSRFDASALMSLPGASLSARAVIALGTPQQQAFFFSRFTTPPCWAFFAVTEPEVGSDTQSVASSLTRCDDGYLLTAHKKFIGGAQLASVGLVFARDGDTQRLVMVDPKRYAQHISITPLEQFGLQGSNLTEISISDMPVQPADILGYERKGLNQGLHALGQVFERHRPMVSAMALGTTYGLLSALDGHPLDDEQQRWVTQQWRTYHLLRRQLAEIAEHYQNGASQYYTTSQLKRRCTLFAESVAHRMPHLLNGQAWLENPQLRRRCRDAFAFEYMEGTANIHLMNSFRCHTARGGVCAHVS